MYLQELNTDVINLIEHDQVTVCSGHGSDKVGNYINYVLLTN